MSFNRAGVVFVSSCRLTLLFFPPSPCSFPLGRFFPFSILHLLSSIFHLPFSILHFSLGYMLCTLSCSPRPCSCSCLLPPLCHAHALTFDAAPSLLPFLPITPVHESHTKSHSKLHANSHAIMQLTQGLPERVRALALASTKGLRPMLTKLSSMRGMSGRPLRKTCIVLIQTAQVFCWVF